MTAVYVTLACDGGNKKADKGQSYKNCRTNHKDQLYLLSKTYPELIGQKFL